MNISTFASMRGFRFIVLLLAVAVLFAHSVSPHHHHFGTSQYEADDHDIHHDHYAPSHDESHGHSPFSFIPIDEEFVKTDVKSVDIVMLPVLASIWLSDIVVTEEPIQLLVKDIEIPPPIDRAGILFRGPPSIC